MKALLSAVAALVVLTLSNWAMADVVVLQNGDRITMGQLEFQYVVQERTSDNEFEVK